MGHPSRPGRRGEQARSAGHTSPVERALSACREQFGEPQLVASAPGRVNLVGGHTDYNDGFVLPVAVDRRTAVAARQRTDDTVHVHSLAFDESATLSVTAPEPGEPRWADYVGGVVQELGTSGYPVTGTDLVVASDVPVGGGLASSAALEVATAFALVAAAGGYPREARRPIAAACRRAENAFVGVPCGPMDQLVATCGERNRALLIDCRSGATEPFPLGTDVTVLVIDTNVSHSLVDSAYGNRRHACEQGVELLASRLDDVGSLRDVSVAAFERHADALPEPVRSRCAHVVRENERVLGAAEALRSGDLSTVGELMTASHTSLRRDYEVSCAELDLVISLLDRPDVYGARMTGAGFGGCVVALVPAEEAARVAETVAREYEAATDVEPDASVCRAVEGARVKSL